MDSLPLLRIRLRAHLLFFCVPQSDSVLDVSNCSDDGFLNALSFLDEIKARYFASPVGLSTEPATQGWGGEGWREWGGGWRFLLKLEFKPGTSRSRVQRLTNSSTDRSTCESYGAESSCQFLGDCVSHIVSACSSAATNLNTRAGGTADTEMKVPFCREPRAIKVTLFKPGVGQNVAGFICFVCCQEFFL